LTITAVVSEQRTYIGLRAQRIVTPTVTPIPADPPVDPVLDNVSALDAPLSLAVVPNIFAEKNVVIGDNFRVDKNTITPKPTPVTPPTFPCPTGNLKVASDLFLRGNLYASEAGKWVILKEYVRNQAPDIQMGSMTLPVASTDVDPSNGSQNLTLTSTLTNPSKAQMLAVLSGIEWQNKTKLKTWFDNVPVESPIKIAVSAGPVTKQAGSTNVYDVTIDWSIGPKGGPVNRDSAAILNVNSITVSYIAVFFP
jgi:hypothetical protein